MSDWNEIERPFREALINGFDWDGLALVLKYHCNRRLDHLTSERKGFVKNVDDVIENAVQEGWLEDLAQGALAENEKHTGLKATVPHILQGVKTEGRAYYQDAPGGSGALPPEPPDEEPGQTEQMEEDRSGPDNGSDGIPPQGDSGLQNRVGGFGADVASGCLATLLAAIITATAAYALRLFAANPDRALLIVALILTVIGLVVTIFAFKSSRHLLGIGAIFFTVGILLFYLIINWCAPWCTDTPIQLEYESTDTSRRIVQNNTIPVDPGSEIRVFAVPFGENVNTNRFLCAWEYLGDGEILNPSGMFGIDQSSCQLLVRTGDDDIADLISAIVGQSGCESQKRRLALLRSILGEGN